MTQQGYITLALGAPRYYDMAFNLALSLKWKDPSRPVCLIHDNSIPLDPFREIFDDLVELPVVAGYDGCANKLRLYEFSPYQETFYIDSDCLVVKSDMDRHWEKFSAGDFNIAGDKATSGSWYDFDIAEACRELTIPYLVKMNSGVVFFRKSSAAEELFSKARSLTSTAYSVIGFDHQGRAGQNADEPFFGAAMGAQNIEPVSYTAEEGSVMVTTYLAKDCDVRLEDDFSTVKKATGYWLFNRFLAKSWVTHQPSVIHFIGLKPDALYMRLTAELRHHNSVTSFMK